MSVILDTEPNLMSSYGYYRFSNYEKLNLKGKYVLVYNKNTHDKLYAARIVNDNKLKVIKQFNIFMHLSKLITHSIYGDRLYKLLDDEEILAVLL